MIRLADKFDIPEILEIITDARKQINDLGFKQWTNDYPNAQTFINDIANNELYVEDKSGVIAVMALVKSINHDYNKIDGNWLSNNKYYTIHRLAVKAEYRHLKIAQSLFNFAYDEALKAGVNLRIDTHPKNLPMQNLIKKMNYVYCGVIFLQNELVEPERLAYELVIE